jgi:hypothetical protein
MYDNASGKGRTIIMNQLKQITDTVLMVRPNDFCFNEETAIDNEFQNKPLESADEINGKAMDEFEKMVKTLQNENVNVLVLEMVKNGVKTPDAVFPNNWISTEHDGTIITYPMATPNRRTEKLRLHDAENLFIKNNFLVKNIINVGPLGEQSLFLEGTGSMIIDHKNRVIYMAESVRSNRIQLNNFLELRSYYQSVVFHAISSNGKPVYHTNVVMSIGEKFAVICSECIPSKDERNHLFSILGKTHEIIDISIEQMENYFCGNILQICSSQGAPLIITSDSALSGFNKLQIEKLDRHGKIVSVNIDTIEKVGGGSARCMMAEVFLPKVKLG